MTKLIALLSKVNKFFANLKRFFKGFKGLFFNFNKADAEPVK